MYDETRLPCAPDDLAALIVSPRATRTLGSGFRRMSALMGDSITVGVYRVVAVPQTETTGVFEVAAGSIVIRP